MKTNKNFILRNIAGDNILVATGEAAQSFNGMITMNEAASFIWSNIMWLSREIDTESTG